jgi:two-component system, sensor histidine kinase and response regulator
MPVVALTAHAMASDRERFLQAGMDDYLAKPIDEAELVRVLSRWLPTVEAPPPPPPPPPLTREALPAALAGLRGIDVPLALERVNRNAALLRRLVEQLHARHADAGRRIGALVAAGDWKAAADAAHTLKGAAATLAAQRIASAAGRIEAGARAQAVERRDIEELQAALDEFAPPLNEPAAIAAAPPAAAIDPLALQAAHEALAQHLARNSFGARAAFATLRSVVGGGGHDDALRQLGDHIDRLEYERAAACLQALATRLDGGKGQ